MSIYIDGATISALLFSHLNSSGSQYGFLIGERIEQVEDRISDSQMHTSDVNYYIYISSFVPWPSQSCIYSRGGHIRDDLLEPILKKSEQNLVGWYSFRHNTSCRPSLREITLHNNLAMTKKYGGQPQDFLFFLSTSSFSSNMSTHTCNHGFMHIIDGHFVKVPVTVMNLGDTTRKEYRKRSSATLSHSKTVQGSLLSFQKDFLKSTGEVEQIAKVNNLASSMNKALMSVHSKVVKSEADLNVLECDVNTLRQQVEKLEEEEMLRIFEMEAKHRRQEEEDRRRDDAKEETEEQEQLDKLLIDLGISCENKDDDVEPEEPASFKELYDANQPPESFQLIDPAPSLPMDSYVFVNSTDSNAESAAQANPATLANENMASGEASSVKVAKDGTQDSKKQQNAKSKISDPFAFIDDELKFKKESETPRLRSTRSNANKNPGVNKMSNQGDAEKSASDNHERNKTSKGGSLKPEMQKKGLKVKNDGGTVKHSVTDNVNGSAPCDNTETQDPGISLEPGLNKQEDNYSFSSSPVF